MRDSASTITGGCQNMTGSTSNPLARSCPSAGIESITGGEYNLASGLAASVTGGTYNTASGLSASVAGGEYGWASGQFASVTGGENNTASGAQSSIASGQGNYALGQFAFVGGGCGNVAGSGPPPTNDSCSDAAVLAGQAILGGQVNLATGFVGSILGGANETLSAAGGSSEAGPTVFGP
jgi:hypothetical protein